MKTIIAIAIVSLLSACATMTPEERSAAFRAKAESMSPGYLCFAINLGQNVPPEAYAVAKERNIDCNSPAMVQMVQIIATDEMQKSASKAAAYQNMMNSLNQKKPIVIPQYQPVPNQTQNIRLQTQCYTFHGITTCN